jgi:SAM-dependent methyltransferase
LSWDDPATARFYEEFDRRHDRYRRMNAELVRQARLEQGMRVLDVGAALGGTARAALPLLGPKGRVLCVEPSAAMQERGLRDLRVEWMPELPTGQLFDRVLCGASIWLLGPLREAVPRLEALVAPGGALAFAIPALYLGEPDRPGGGTDPLLLRLPALVAAGRVPQALEVERLPVPDDVDVLLAAEGLEPRRWSFELRLTQAALRDWLKIPPLTDALLPGLGADERAVAIDAAYARADPASWRFERWLGWTATR